MVKIPIVHILMFFNSKSIIKCPTYNKSNITNNKNEFENTNHASIMKNVTLP